MSATNGKKSMTSFVECAFYGAPEDVHRMPIIHQGIMVRDYATFIRDNFHVPEGVDVILHDAESGRAFSGKHWIYPESALLIRLQPEQVCVKTSFYAGTSIQEEEEDQEPLLEEKTPISIYVDAVYFDMSNKVGFSGFSATKTGTPFSETNVISSVIKDVYTTKQCELTAVLHAMDYIKKHVCNSASVCIHTCSSFLLKILKDMDVTVKFEYAHSRNMAVLRSVAFKKILSLTKT